MLMKSAFPSSEESNKKTEHAFLACCGCYFSSVCFSGTNNEKKTVYYYSFRDIVTLRLVAVGTVYLFMFLFCFSYQRSSKALLRNCQPITL